MPLSRELAPASLALVYIWFGALKVAGHSPAAELVSALLEQTLPLLGAAPFLVGLGLFELLVGALLLSERRRRLGVALMILHMGATLLPLVLLPERAWQGPLVPSLEGQYTIKNLVFVALGLYLAAGVPTPADAERVRGLEGRYPGR